jgi:neutral ceramidase
MRIATVALCALLSFAYSQGVGAQTEPNTSLLAGASKIDVTPAASELPKGYEGVQDRIHVRTIVVSSGGHSAVLIMLDAGGISEDLWKGVSGRVETELSIPKENILLTATHTHSVPPPQSVPALAEKIIASVRAAKSNLKPARMGFGTGVSYLNVNRNIIDPKTRRWWEGPNYDGPSDKTVAVIKFETLSGEPIAVYYNYAMHGVTVGQLDKVSGDAPGAASKYIEDSLDDKIVALWSSGAAGDQNPLYFQQTYDLREIRIKDYAKRGQDISNAMPPGGQGLNRQDPKVARLMSQQVQMIQSMGQFLGEEVLHVMRGIERTETAVPIYGVEKTVSCPGRERTDTGRAGFSGSYVDANPVDLRLSLLMVGDVAIAGVNAEIFNLISQRLKKESRFEHTMMATLTNGMARSGYVPNDAAFGYNTFEVVSSRLKPGCAENAIVNGFLDLMPAIKY